MTSETLIRKLEAAGFEPHSYSGRAMFGRQCVAVSGGGMFVWPATAVLRGWRQDSMGRGAVIYWPEVAWPGEIDDAELPDGRA